MHYRLFVILLAFMVTQSVSGQKYSTRTAHLFIQSSNSVANIAADNYQVNSTIDAATGKVNIVGLLKSFEFRIGGLDQAFNSDLVKTITHPKFKYTGEITNIQSVNLNSAGTYPIQFKGVLYLWNLERITPGTGTIEVHTDGSISVSSDISFQIEEASVDRANTLIKSYLPSGINLSTDQLGISRTIQVEANGTYSKR